MSNKAAIYARFSCDNQRIESITAQLRAAREYCKSKDYEVVAEYIDEAQSGTTASREAFQKMVRDAKTFDVAVFHKIDRAGRNEYDYYYYKGQLRNSGVRLEYADQKIDESPEGQLMESFLVGMAAYYSRNLAREVQKGMRENAHQAKHNGGRPALGYDVREGKYIINESEAATVRHIFQRRAEGASYNTIISELNQFGWRTKRGQPFVKNSLLEILRNPKYIGTYRFGVSPNTPTRNNHQPPGKNTIIIEDSVPPIIDRQTWDVVQSRIVKKLNGSGTAKADYILSGHIFCQCGAAMQGTSTTTRGKKYLYYKCGAWDRKTGKKGIHQRIQLEQAESGVWKEIKKNFLEPSRRGLVIKEILSAQLSVADAQTDELDALEQAISDAGNRIEKILDAIETGGIDPVMASERIEAQKKRRDGAKERMNEISKKAKRMFLTEPEVADLLDRLDMPENQPGAFILLVKKLKARVVVEPKALRVRLVLALDGAGEPTCSARQLIAILTIYKSRAFCVFRVVSAQE